MRHCVCVCVSVRGWKERMRSVVGAEPLSAGVDGDISFQSFRIPFDRIDWQRDLNITKVV